MTDQSMDSLQNLLARYSAAPAQLAALLTPLTPAQLDLRPAPSGGHAPDLWSVRQIAQHTVDGDALWKMGILAALGNPGATFSLQWYWDQPQMAWAAAWQYAERSLETSLALFRANRAQVAELLQRDPSAWERSLRIPWPGRPADSLSVQQMVEMQTRHAGGHLDDMRAILLAHPIQ